MFGISLWYGISLEALKTANPTVNPYAMGVGTVLLIPLTPEAGSTPRPTPEFYPDTHAPVFRHEPTGLLPGREPGVNLLCPG